MILAVVDKLRELEASTGMRLVTTELEIISVLYDEGPISVQALMGRVRASPSGFHLIKKCMHDTGLIVGDRSDQDARVKLLDLSPDLRANLAAIYKNPSAANSPRPGLDRLGQRAGDRSISQHA